MTSANVTWLFGCKTANASTNAGGVCPSGQQKRKPCHQVPRRRVHFGASKAKQCHQVPPRCAFFDYRREGCVPTTRRRSSKKLRILPYASVVRCAQSEERHDGRGGVTAYVYNYSSTLKHHQNAQNYLLVNTQIDAVPA